MVNQVPCVSRSAGGCRRRGDDSGSLMFALLLMFLATALASLMTPVLLDRDERNPRRPARVAEHRGGRGRHRRRDGPDPGRERRHRPVDGYTVGVLSKLPCGTLTGSVSAAGNSRYSVTVSYYASDPRGQNAQPG